MKDPQDVDEHPEDFKEPPMRWNTGLMQFEPDLEHEEQAPPEGSRYLLGWLLILLFILPFLIVLLVLLLA